MMVQYYGDQGDGQVVGHLHGRPGGGRISQSSKEFEELRQKFEKQDIGKDQPHSQILETFQDFFPEKVGGLPSARVKRQILPRKKTFNILENEVTNGISAARNKIMGTEISTNRKRGIYELEGELPITPGKRRK